MNEQTATSEKVVAGTGKGVPKIASTSSGNVAERFSESPPKKDQEKSHQDLSRQKTSKQASTIRKTARIVLNTSIDEFSTLPKDMRDDTVKKIGSVFKVSVDGKTSTRDVIRGLDPIQEKVYLPTIIGVPHDHSDFIKLARNFWVEFKITPPIDPGKLVDYTTRREKVPEGIQAAEGEGGMYDAPVSLYDYMEYRFCMQNPKVAKEPTELNNLGLYKFYLIDEAARKQDEAKKYVSKEEADMLFVMLVKGGGVPVAEDIAKMDWVIQVLKKPEDYLDLQTMEVMDKKMWLSKRKTTEPAKFVTVVSDENLEYKALKVMLVERSLLKYEGDHYYYGDENIGKETGVISWLRSPNNGDKIRDLKLRLEDKLKQEKRQLQI